MSYVLISREKLEERALAHYRVGGEKKGVRNYQYKDGSLTPLGRIHYGVGTGRDRSLMKGKAGFVLGNKLVDKDGGLTKKGIEKVEESGKRGYLKPTDEDKKHGRAQHRLDLMKQMKEESEKEDPNRESGNNVHSIGKEIFDKYKDKYAEATLEDLKLPVNEKNKGAVKDAFEKYDTYYDWDAGTLDSEHAQAREKEFADRWNKRFKKDAEDKTDKDIKNDVESGIKAFNEKTQAAREERAAKEKSRKEELKKNLEEIRSLTDEDLDKRIARLQKERQYSELLNERENREKGPLHAMASKLFKEAAEKLARKSLDMATDELLKKARGSMNKNNKSNDDNKPDGESSKPKDSNSNGNSGNSGGKFSKAEKTQIRSMANSGKSIAEIAKSLGTTEDRVKGFMKSAGITIS